jgi:hypothetical protein
MQQSRQHSTATCVSFLSLLLKLTHPLILLHVVRHRVQPVRAVLHEKLHRWSYLRVCKVEVVDGADAQDAHAGESSADTIHQRATRPAKVIGHLLARCDRARLAEGLEVVAAAEVLQVRVGDGEVGGEHGRGDLAAVAAVADKAVDQAFALGRLYGSSSRRHVRGEHIVGKIRMKSALLRRRASLSRGPLTKASCTAPQKQVAVASSSLE